VAEPPSRSDQQRRIDDLEAQGETDRATIRGLEHQGETDRATIRGLEHQGETDRATIRGLQLQADVDHALIERLQAEGEIEREKIANLDTALATCRRIGAAIGVLMASTKVTDKQAFDLLVRESQSRHRKLREVAEDVVLTGALPQHGDKPRS